MRLIILQSPNDVSIWAAKYVRKKIIEFNPGPDRYFVLGLPTGQLILSIFKKIYLVIHLHFTYLKCALMVITIHLELRYNNI